MKMRPALTTRIRNAVPAVRCAIELWPLSDEPGLGAPDQIGGRQPLARPRPGSSSTPHIHSHAAAFGPYRSTRRPSKEALTFGSEIAGSAGPDGVARAGATTGRRFGFGSLKRSGPMERPGSDPERVRPQSACQEMPNVDEHRRPGHREAKPRANRLPSNRSASGAARVDSVPDAEWDRAVGRFLDTHQEHASVVPARVTERAARSCLRTAPRRLPARASRS